MRAVESAPHRNANGGGGIRTPGAFRHSGFQDRHLKPLGHSSSRKKPHWPTPCGFRTSTVQHLYKAFGRFCQSDSVSSEISRARKGVGKDMFALSFSTGFRPWLFSKRYARILLFHGLSPAAIFKSIRLHSLLPRAFARG